jgi:hypothetical protein
MTVTGKSPECLSTRKVDSGQHPADQVDAQITDKSRRRIGRKGADLGAGSGIQDKAVWRGVINVTDIQFARVINSCGPAAAGARACIVPLQLSRRRREGVRLRARVGNKYRRRSNSW